MELFARRCDLFSDFGDSKDHRPDVQRMVVGMVLDQNGNPVCSELWPGNTAGLKIPVPIVERLKRRFGIGSVYIVAGRAMISAETPAEVAIHPERAHEESDGSPGGGGARRPERSLAAKGEKSLGRGCAHRDLIVNYFPA